VACGSATLRQPARRPSCPGSEPAAELPGARVRSRRLSPGCCSLTSLPPGSSSLPGPTVSLGYERNHTHETA